MTKENLEKARFLAVFMGYEYKPEDTLNDVKGVYRKEGMLPMLITDFKYHSSWDALMPVYKRFINLQGMPMPAFMHHVNCVCNWVQRANIDESYLSMVEAIRWLRQTHTGIA
jgi:hypothetical protein